LSKYLQSVKFAVVAIAALAITYFASSCNKQLDNSCDITNTISTPDSQVNALQTYIDTNHIAAIRHPKGFFYSISDTGVGTVNPTLCNIVSVNYWGQFLDGKTFDKGHNISFYLKSVISGWQLAVPLLRNGGTMTVYLPPYLAYGTAGDGVSIPANTPLKFTIQLVAVK
jgi:FKBP-type peptidyl-prolyl cis-trans isomerase